jgi:hypothetical protein
MHASLKFSFALYRCGSKDGSNKRASSCRRVFKEVEVIKRDAMTDKE